MAIPLINKQLFRKLRRTYRSAQGGPTMKRQAFLQQLHAEGELNQPNDRKGLFNFMKKSPGEFPMSSDPDYVTHEELDAFINQIVDQLGDDSDGLIGPASLTGSLLEASEDRFTPFLKGLKKVVTVAVSTGADVTLENTAVPGPLSECVLWLHTSGGKVKYVTDITVDTEDIYLGPNGWVDAMVADVELAGENHLITGIWLGTVKETVSVTAYIEGSVTDVAWGYSLSYLEEGDDQEPGRRPRRSKLIRGRRP